MNSNRNQNLYDLSRQIQEEEDKAFQQQAKKIANAYREVQQLKVNKPKSIQPKQQSGKNKPQSTYALKVKQTLNQLKSQQNKESSQLKKFTVQPHLDNRHRQKEEIKLKNAAVSKLYSTVQHYWVKVKKEMLKKMIQFSQEDEKKEDSFLLKFRKYKLFRAWKEEFILSKLERERKQQSDFFQMQKGQELSKQFRIFSLLKRTFKGWKQYTRREAKKRAYEQQLRRLELEKMMKEEEKSQKNPVRQNQELQNKLRGFLDGLKGKIENKDRLKTIKENPDQSDFNLKIRSEINQEESQEEPINSQIQKVDSDAESNSDQQHQIIIQPPEILTSQQKKAMTNEELQKRRQELEHKHRRRKEALGKLKKEKEQKKREEQLQRTEIQREVQMEQKRIKQQKYRQFVKNKQEQEQWEKKEKQLQLLAQNFNTKRLLKYYGWIPLSNAKTHKKNQVNSLYQTLLLIIYRFQGVKFFSNLTENCQAKLSSLYQKMKARYERKLKNKSLRCFSENLEEERQNKKDYNIQHEVNLLKIHFSEWKRVHPSIVASNFDWERPRLKKAEEFHKIQLLYKGLCSLKENKMEEQKSRTIFQQKQKIKSKIHDLLGQEQINYEQFL